MCLTADVTLPLVWADSFFLSWHSERLSRPQGSIMLLGQKMTTSPHCWLAILRLLVCARLWVHVCALCEVRMFALFLFHRLLRLFAWCCLQPFFCFTHRLWQLVMQSLLLCLRVTHTCIASRCLPFKTSVKTEHFEIEIYSRVARPEEPEYDHRITCIDWPVLCWSMWPCS